MFPMIITRNLFLDRARVAKVIFIRSLAYEPPGPKHYNLESTFARIFLFLELAHQQ